MIRNRSEAYAIRYMYIKIYFQNTPFLQKLHEN